MPKNQARNAFYFFMKEMQEAERRKGNSFSMAEMSTIASPKWTCLTPEEKAKYEKMAKEYKAKKKGTYEGKYTSDGYRIIDIKKLTEEQEEKENKLIEEVMDYVKSLRVQCNDDDFEALMNHSFYIMSFNLLCKTEDNMYIPIEVGICEYSIKNGVTNKFHRFIDPGQIPLGYSALAKEHAEATHQIPIMNFEAYERDYERMCRDICHFIKVRRTRPMVFSITDQVTQTEGCLTWLGSLTRDDDIHNIVVRDLLVLLMELRAVKKAAFPSRIVAESMLRKNVFDFTAGLNCTYHEDLDNNYCALGYTRRLCCMLSDALCKVYNVTPTPSHLPTRPENISYEVYHPPMESIPPSRYNVLVPPGVTDDDDNEPFTVPSRISRSMDSAQSSHTRGASCPATVQDRMPLKQATPQKVTPAPPVTSSPAKPEVQQEWTEPGRRRVVAAIEGLEERRPMTRPKLSKLPGIGRGRPLNSS